MEILREIYENMRAKFDDEDVDDTNSSLGPRSTRKDQKDIRMHQLKRKGIKSDPGTEQTNLLTTASNHTAGCKRGHSPKRNSIDTVVSSQSTSRRGSKSEVNID